MFNPKPTTLKWHRLPVLAQIFLTATLAFPFALGAADLIPAPGPKLPPATNNLVITAADVSVEKVGTNIPVSAIGEPVGGVTLSAPRWSDATPNSVAYATVDGAIAPKDPKGKPINFRVLLPASWGRRAIQMGGGGMNGTVPMMRGERPGSPTATFVTYGSDSGHQMGGFGFPGMGGGPRGGGGGGDDWALNEEAVRNLGYMQMKKTHDAAMVILERVYGERPRFNYYIGSSQGGREALTVAQRYPADYDGIVANVPIVGFSTLMLAPELIRIQEKPLSNWVTRAKVNAIRGEFMRQADKLDGLEDGVINNYMAARALFDMSEGDPNRNPWAALRAPDGVDPNPVRHFRERAADGRPDRDAENGLQPLQIRHAFGQRREDVRHVAAEHRSLGQRIDRRPALSRTGGRQRQCANALAHGRFRRDRFSDAELSANPLDYVEGGPLNARREEISKWLDSTDPDLSAFYKRGGKMIVTIGTDDTLASPGTQLDYYQSVLDKMGRDTVDAFARFFVIPQVGHGLSGRSYGTTGDGKSVPTFAIPEPVSTAPR